MAALWLDGCDEDCAEGELEAEVERGSEAEVVEADALAGRLVLVESIVFIGSVVRKVAASSSNKLVRSQSHPDEVELFTKQQKRLSPHCFMP